MGNLIYRDESYAIIGAAMEVHKTLGYGFLEAVYQKALEYEFSVRKIPFFPQVKLDVTYKEITIEKSYIADFLVFDKIIVEIKANNKLTIGDMAQVQNYLKATQLQLGLLFNFGEASLKHERVLQIKGYKSLVDDPEKSLKVEKAHD